MTSFRVLVVDDEEYVRVAAESQLAAVVGTGQVELVTCAGAEDSYAAIDEAPWDIAFVDLNLTKSFETGRGVLQALAERSPTCERIAMTQHLDHDTHRWIDLVSPAITSASDGSRATRVVDGVIAKSLDANWFSRVSLARLPLAVHSESLFEGIDELAASLLEKTYRRSRKELQVASDFRDNATAVRLELERLFWRLYAGVRGFDQPLELRISPLNQGLSSAVTVACEVRLDTVGGSTATRFGSRTVLKFGTRKSIEREVVRYANVVRYGVPLDSRVELLDWAYGDGLGVLAYSFAGGGERRIFSLDDCGSSYLDPSVKSPPREWCIASVERLFDKDEARWYRVSGPDEIPRQYFTSELSVKFERAIEILSNRLDSLARREHVVLMKDEVVIGTTRLRIPRTDFLGSGEFLLPMRTCLTHGDFHGGNVLIDAPERASLIDFAHSGFGPRAIDAAVLNGSIRLWDSRLLPDLSNTQLLGEFLADRLVAEHRLALADRSLDQRRRPVCEWHEVSATLDRENEAIFDGFIALERLVPYCLHAVRMMGFDFDDRKLNANALLRLLCWYSAVHQAILSQRSPESPRHESLKGRLRRS